MKYITLYLLLLINFVVNAEELPRAEIETNMGKIVLELYPQQAPRSVKNFVHYAQQGFYENTIFHRVIPKFIMQGGGYTENFEKKPTRDPIVNEADNGLKNLRGTVAMARHTDESDSATSQFFINLADNAFLDYTSPLTPKTWGYTIFAKVIEGMEVVDKMEKVKTGSGGEFSKNVPIQPIIINKVTVLNIPTNLDDLIANTTKQTTAPKMDRVGMTGVTKEDDEENTDDDMADDDATDDEVDDETDMDDDDADADADADVEKDDVNWDDDEASDDEEDKEAKTVPEKTTSKATVKDTTKKVTPSSHQESKPQEQPAPDAPSKPDVPEPLAE